MLYSKLFGKTLKDFPKDEISINSKYLLRAGFIDKLMAGSYTLLPLGRLVELKIEKIVREEMNVTGAEEVLMPLLHPKSIWNETGRWESAKEVMYQFTKDDKEYALSFTHEEIVMDLIRKHFTGYKDFPIMIYHFSTKFRDEPRAKSGLLRGREFLMKDLYSAHTTKEDMLLYYKKVIDAYFKTFQKIDLEVKMVEAAGGVFTKENTHEFQVLSEGGEDTIYFCDKCNFAQNKEIFKGKENDICPKCKKGKIKISHSIEVGNIFPLGTVYAEKMNVYVNVKDGKKNPVWLASYGIGITRLIATLVEIYHDDRGIIWPEPVAPFKYHMIGLDLKDAEVKKQINKVYKLLEEKKIEVLFDDREDVSAGEKFADADLIGIPYRLVVSKRTGNKIELKKKERKQNFFGTIRIFTTMKIIVTHLSPDLDAITSVWLIKSFLQGWKNAQVKFVPAGKTLDNMSPDSNQEIIHVDTGLGRFDHHQTPDFTCASILVLNYLNEQENIKDKLKEPLKHLVNFVNEDDHFQEAFYPDPTEDRYDFLLNNLIDGLKVTMSNDLELTEFIFRILDAALIIMRNKISAEEEIRMGLIFKSYLGKSLAMETGNDETLKLAQKMGYNLVIRKDPKHGNVRIKTLPNPKFDLTPIYEQIKKNDHEGSWFLHSSKHMLLNGSPKRPDQKPSPLSLKKLIEIIKNI